MNRYIRIALILMAVASIVAGCDTHEDPYLLNPPLPDSSSVRVVNLSPTDRVNAAFPGFPIVTELPPYQVSDYKQFLLLEMTSLMVGRPGQEPDTLTNQTLARGALTTYVVFPASDTSLATLRLVTGTEDEADLASRNEARVSFINGIKDSSYFIKLGCQSGDTIFTSTLFAQPPAQFTTTARDLSLYLFNGKDSLPLATARVQPLIGTTTYLIAGMNNGRPALYLLPARGSGGALPAAEVETRTTATVELVNALTDGRTISATIDGGSGSIASGLGPLTIAPAAEVQACVDPTGDSLVVSPATGEPFKTPIRLSVGGRSLVVVYNQGSTARAVTLSRDPLPGSDGKVHIRAVNAAPGVPKASIAIGAGAPDTTIPPDYRPFGSVDLGMATGYVPLTVGGNYPLLLNSAETGRFYSGGVENLTPGYYTVIVVERLGIPTLMIVRDDVPGAQLRPLQSAGVRVTFFNAMPDMRAEFSAGGLSLPSLPYSYSYSTVLPLDATTVGSNAGSAPINLTTGSYMVGATGSGSSRKLLAFPVPTDSLPPLKAGIRFLNTIPDGPPLAIRISDSSAAAMDVATPGTPTPERQIDERQYSVFVTPAEANNILARTDGIRLSAGRRYLLIITPKRPGSTSSFQYETIWIQE